MSDSQVVGPSTLKRSLNRQSVLDEDEYTQALEHIIARDFYPSLVHLDATNEYLDALQSQDATRIGDSVRRLEEIQQTPIGQTPLGYRGETPLRTPRGEPLTKRPRYNDSLSLDTFQARYTSEDNSSFTEILDDENQKRRNAYRWVYDAERRAKETQLKVEQSRERMLIEPPGGQGQTPGIRQKLRIEQPLQVRLITAGGEEERAETETEMALVFGPEDEQESAVDVMAPKKDTRVATVDGWRFKARNALMFGPDANESPYHTEGKPIPELNPKYVNHANTRVLEAEDSGSHRSSSVPPSPTRSRINAAITDTPYRPSGSSSDSFSLVPNLPSPTPAELGPKAVKQLMTMGTLMSTPRIISKDGDGPSTTPFRIAHPSSRESLSHRLAGDARKSMRHKASILTATPRSRARAGGNGGSMPPPSWTPRKKAASLTPAARNLLDRSMGSAASRRAHAMERTAGWTGATKEQDLARVRWTPTPGERR